MARSPLTFLVRELCLGTFIQDWWYPQASARRPFMLNWADWMRFYDVDKGSLGAWTGAFWGECGVPPQPGSAPLKGSKRLRLWAKPLGSSGKADLGQEEPGRGTNDSLSHILQGKIQQCVWPLGLNVDAALAPSAAQIKALGQQHKLSGGIQPMISSIISFYTLPCPKKFQNTVLIT